MFEFDALRQRGRALEDEYFQRVDHELLKDLREKTLRCERIAELGDAIGLGDSQICQHLLDVGIDATNVAALTLTPMVFAAWASGTVTPEERQNVISVALRRGVNSNPLAFRLLEQWLQTRPPRELWDAWKEYVLAVYETLPRETANKLRSRMLVQLEQVALASGGVLGVGKICRAEQRLIDEIEDWLPTRTDSQVET